MIAPNELTHTEGEGEVFIFLIRAKGKRVTNPPWGKKAG